MMKLYFVFVLLVLMCGCAKYNPPCVICGNFNLESLSKSEEVKIGDPKLSGRHHIRLLNGEGTDFYTMWRWSDEKQVKPWNDQMEYSIKKSRGKLLINNDRTWSWQFNAETVVEPSDHFSVEKYWSNTVLHEGGSWTYANRRNDQILLTVRYLNYHQKLNDWMTKDSIIHSFSKEIKETNTTKRRFLFEKNQNKLTLKSIDQAQPEQWQNWYQMSYSLLQGNVIGIFNQNKIKSLPIAQRIR